MLCEPMPAPTVLLLIPPLTQLNTPYPSTAYLTGFLQSQGVACEQADLGIEMVLKLFSHAGLSVLFDQLRDSRKSLPVEAKRMLAAERAYLDLINPVVAFLQGKNRIALKTFSKRSGLPHGARFKTHPPLPPAASQEDRAKHHATLFLEDLTDLVRETITPHFAMSRYAEQIARSASSFDTVVTALHEEPRLTDQFMLDALWEHVDRVKPSLIGLSVPFPGNLYGAFRVAQAVKHRHPDLTIALGGGYPNTELRRVSDPRVFDYVDFITLDDGERPLLSLLEYLSARRSRDQLCRTFYRDRSRVLYANDPSSANFSMDQVGCPTYRGLPLDRYLSILDSTNPMHRLWSEGHWNKLTVAHGCYWKQCTFCDVGLDYIARYEMTPTERLVRQILQLIAETGRRDFHFVDEAAPPAALKALALALLEENIRIRWWGNIRFEEAFTPDLCRLLAASGCIAVTAGLEAASDRLLEKMKKGITVDQTALVAAAFRQAGILVHAYLMYGFPSETIQETIDSLERLRQLFAADLIQSAFWHRFTATAHSPVGLHPKSNGLRILGPPFEGFAENDLIHRDRVGPAPDWLSEGLRRSLLNYLEGRGLALDVRRWFDHSSPKPLVSSRWVKNLLQRPAAQDISSAERQLVWLGERLVCKETGARSKLALTGRKGKVALMLPRSQAAYLAELLNRARPFDGDNLRYPPLREAKKLFPGGTSEFDLFLRSAPWKSIRRAGLLLV